ncbi:hypothetical protein HDV00_008996 [Rhizophlyctis rosea]|nr:hypothetical protein HDV00_008996 [Rhizophlyctis rosea]
MQKGLRELINLSSIPEKLQVYGILFGGPCACILRMNAKFYTPSTDNPNNLRRPYFLLATSPVWNFQADQRVASFSAILADYVSALSEVHHYATTTYVNLRAGREEFMASADLEVGKARKGTKDKRKTQYPRSMAVLPVAKRARLADEDEDKEEEEEEEEEH